MERCAPSEAAPAVRALIQKQRDALEEMSTLIREIDASHVRYRKRAVQRAQFLLLSDRSAQGSVTALLRRYAEDIKTPDQLFEPDDGPLAARPSVTASTLADEYPNDFARIIGLHTYSQSPRRCYDIQLTGEWATRGGFRFEEFTLTPRKEDAEDDRNE